MAVFMLDYIKFQCAFPNDNWCSALLKGHQNQGHINLKSQR